MTNIPQKKGARISPETPTRRFSLRSVLFYQKNTRLTNFYQRVFRLFH